MIGYLDFEALERYTNMSQRWWRYRLDKVPHIRLPGKILFKASDIDEYFRQFQKTPKEIDISGLLDRVVPSRRNRGPRQGAS